MLLEIKYYKSGEIPNDVIENLLESAEKDKVPFTGQALNLS
jgi:hypothetical protein